MSLFRKHFYRKAPDRLVEISEHVYAFDCCFSCDVMGDDEYKLYLDGIVAQLHDHYPDASFMVCNFRAGYQRSRISTLLSQYRMWVMDYPNQQGSVPLLPLQVISQFLISSESWLGQQNVMLMHCERGSLPLLDFMLSALLLYIDRYHGDQKTLELAYNQGSMELLRHASSLNPRPSQLRYLQYISTSSEWPSSEAPLLLDCLILKGLSHFEWRRDWRPSLRVFGQDPKARACTCRSSILLFSTPKTDHMYQQEECILVMLDIQCRVQGDVVLEFVNLSDNLVCEEMIFRIMFHTAFVRGNVLKVRRTMMDILWDAKDEFPKELEAEVSAPDNVSEIEAFSEELEKMEAVKETRMKKAKGASDVNISSFAVDNVNLNKRGEVDLEPSLPGTKPEKTSPIKSFSDRSFTGFSPRRRRRVSQGITPEPVSCSSVTLQDMSSFMLKVKIDLMGTLPIVADTFPSKISFNVRIHGIPLHFWSEGTIRTIGEQLGKSSIKDEKDARIWVEVNGLEPLIMKMDIELPTDEITEVELEYLKIEKHCFTCFSLFHEELDCPHRPLNALPPKERLLGITQSIALQRIEAEKRRHDDRRGYRRPKNSAKILDKMRTTTVRPRKQN
uniref:C2 tensin-type domain-containing protein n=1 Tax=Brassica oleracea TaxID=3712 RepID=A0A3P6EKS6_BRAOL|nr:unnamed protein product [Brassica oleracea]